MTEGVAEIEAESGEPYPPVGTGRRRWTLLVVGVLLITGVMWVLWDRVSQRRLQGRIDAIRAADEPLYLEDFAGQELEDQRNAAFYYLAAGQAYAASGEVSPTGGGMSRANYMPLPFAWVRAADRAVARNTQALALVEQGNGCAGANWHALDPNWFTAQMQSIKVVRALAELLVDAAAVAHFHGDDVRAIGLIREQFAVADSTLAFGHFLTDLTASGMSDAAVKNLDFIAADLQIEGAGNVSASTRPVSRQTVKDLIALLLDGSVTARYRKSMALTERMDVLTEVMAPLKSSTVLRPRYQSQAAQMLEAEEVFGTAMAKEDFPSANWVIRHGEAKSPVDRWLDQSWYHVEMIWGQEARRREAAVALAIRMYRIDHKGWPADLAVLVPEYLPYVPDNPMRAGHAGIGYFTIKRGMPDRSDRPMLYLGRASATTRMMPSVYRPYVVDDSGGWDWLDLARWPAPRPARFIGPRMTASTKQSLQH